MYIVTVDVAVPTRLDRYLKRLRGNLSQGLIEQSLRQGKIKVNNRPATANCRLLSGDLLSITDSLAQPQPSYPVINCLPAATKLAQQLLTSYLIYEGSELIAINKPAGLATQGGSKISLSVDDGLAYLNQQNHHFRLVHRLDKETSGALLIAKSYIAAHTLTSAFKAQLMVKSYLAISLGRPVSVEGEISSLISKSRGGIYEIVQENCPNAKLAITRYQLLKFANNFALIRFMPLTGRMHQLRFHAQKLGCPIIGDSKYGTEISRSYSRQMLLHAEQITIPQAVYGTEIVITAPLPGHFKPYQSVFSEYLSF